jgi:hypothetical protein
LFSKVGCFFNFQFELHFSLKNLELRLLLGFLLPLPYILLWHLPMCSLLQLGEDVESGGGV